MHPTLSQKTRTSVLFVPTTEAQPTYLAGCWAGSQSLQFFPLYLLDGALCQATIDNLSEPQGIILRLFMTT